MGKPNLFRIGVKLHNCVTIDTPFKTVELTLDTKKDAQVRGSTSNDIIAGNGIERFMIELKFIERYFFVYFKVLCNF